MQNKIAVHFRETDKTLPAFKRLRTCKGCGNFTSLWENGCKACGKEGGFVPAEVYAGLLNKRYGQVEAMIIGAAACIAMVAARNFTELAFGALAAICIPSGYLLIRKHFSAETDRKRLEAILLKKHASIRTGLTLDLLNAEKDLEADQYKQAYEKMRETGYLLNADPIKRYKVRCLNAFVLRADMELELDTVVPDNFDPAFCRYLWEVSKVNKRLIKRRSFDYTMVHRTRIEELDYGRELLTNIAAAALRMKVYIDTYQILIIDYMEFLPRDRFLRLCKVLAAGSVDPQQQVLHDRTRELLRIKYSFDPDFQGIF